MNIKKNRSPEMQQVVDAFAKNAFGRTATEAIAQHVCVICGKPIEGFKDVLSRREYRISGMCQECQDETFGVSDNDDANAVGAEDVGDV